MCINRIGVPSSEYKSFALLYHVKVQIYVMIPSLPARAPCLAPTDPRRPSPALSTHRFNFQPKCLLPVFVQTLIVAPSNQADMALSALYLHNVNHRAAARPSLGQLSAYNFQVSAISSYDRQWERDFLIHPSTLSSMFTSNRRNQ